MENLKCSICSLRDFQTRSEFHEHEEWCRNSLFHICRACNKSYSSELELAIHVVQHTQEEHSLCPYCNRGVLKHGFEQHITKHHGVKPTKGISRVPLIEAFDTQTAFTVTESQNEIAPAGSFESLVDFDRASRRNEKPVEPVASSDSGEESDSKVERGARPGRYPCEICGIVFTKLSHEIKHKKIHLGARPFNCPYCEKTFTADRGVKKHIFRLHPEHSERAWNVKLPDSNSDLLGEVRSFLCLLCKRTFRRKAIIKEHVAVMHVGHTMRFPFVRRSPQTSGMQCATCHQDFALQEHLLLHTSMRPYTCEYCKKTLQGKRSLRAHLITLHKLPVNSVDRMICELPTIQPEFEEESNESAKKQHLTFANIYENCPICQDDETCVDDPALDYDFLKQHIWTAHVPSAPATSALSSFWTLT